MKPRVVFDTNILISAQLSLTGAPFRCLALAHEDLVESITCKEILAELGKVLSTKFGYPSDLVDQVVKEIEGISEVVEISGNLKVIANDPDDDKVIESALLGGAKVIVSGDRRHLLPLKNYQGVAILSASEFLAEFANSNE